MQKEMMAQSLQESAQTPGLTFLCRITARVAQAVSLGAMPLGERRFVPIIGGEVQGESLNGTVLAGGGDWQLLRQDGTLDIQAHYILKTSDGELIEVFSEGCRHGSPSVMKRLSRNEPVPASEYYFRTLMRFQTASPARASLNSVVAVGIASRLPDAAVLDVYLID